MCVNNTVFTQENKLDYSSPKEYFLAGVTITGTKFLDKNTLISISGLGIGEKITIPSEKISKAIKNLWKQGLFSDVSIEISKIEDQNVFLNINLKENTKLSKFNFKGEIKKHDVTELKDLLKLMRGKVLTDNLINNSIYKIKQYFVDKGFNNVKVNYEIADDNTTLNAQF